MVKEFTISDLNQFESMNYQPRSSSPSSSDSFKHIQNLHNNRIGRIRCFESLSGESGDDSKSETTNESNPESTVEDPPDHLESEMPNSDFTVINRNAELNIGENQRNGEANCREVLVREMGHSFHGEFNMGSSLNKEDMLITVMQLQFSELMEENLQQQSELIKRNDQKRETIKHLCLQIDRLTTENRKLQNCLKCSKVGTETSQSWISKLKAFILGKLLGCAS